MMGIETALSSALGNTKDRPSYYLFAKNGARDCIGVAPILDNRNARIQSAAPNFLSQTTQHRCGVDAS